MGIDYGTRRIGVALSDPLHLTAQPFRVLDRRDGDIIARLRRIADERDVERIVVGLPLALSGREGVSAEAARDLAQGLSEATGLPVEMWDERFTTKTAEAALIEGNVSRTERRRRVDKVAAAVMLQHYLDRK